MSTGRSAPPGPPPERPRLLAVVTDSCTGCGVCLDFCPVGCIEPPEPPPAPRPPAPVLIREADCIGCRLCAAICEQLTLHAIAMVPAAAR